MSMYNEDTQFNAMNKRIVQLEAENDRLSNTVAILGREVDARDQRIAELRLEIIAATGQAQTALEENTKLRDALQEIADSTHLGNSWAKHKAKEALARFTNQT